MNTHPSSALRRRLLLPAAALLLLLPLWAQAQSGNAPSVDLETARAALSDSRAGHPIVFDIREPQEHATGVASGARLLPMSQLGARLGEIPKDQPVLLMCNTQNRSRKAAEALWQRGYTQVRYVQGGMSQWAARGWPMVAPPR